MNFLGHAYIARNNPELIAGNFAGDSYKGNLEKFDHLPENVLNGVRLHRFIDDFTDHHEAILEVANRFQNRGVQKVSYIACDIILDHHLSANWENYSAKAYPEFIDNVYHHTELHLNELPERFNFLYSRLKEYGWFFDYPSIEGIGKILNQFSNRIGFENDLRESLNVYIEEKKDIDLLFNAFISDIVEKSEGFILDLKG